MVLAYHWFKHIVYLELLLLHELDNEDILWQ